MPYFKKNLFFLLLPPVVCAATAVSVNSVSLSLRFTAVSCMYAHELSVAVLVPLPLSFVLAKQ